MNVISGDYDDASVNLNHVREGDMNPIVTEIQDQFDINYSDHLPLFISLTYYSTVSTNQVREHNVLTSLNSVGIVQNYYLLSYLSYYYQM